MLDFILNNGIFNLIVEREYQNIISFSIKHKYVRKFNGKKDKINSEILKFVFKNVKKIPFQSQADICAKNGELKILKLLDIQDNSIIESIFENDNFKILKFLMTMTNIDNLEILDNFLGSYIHGDLDILIVRNNQLNFLKMLMRKKIGVNNYCIELACKCGHIKMLKFLISVGLHINDDGYEWACCKGHLKIVKFLLQNGINVYDQDSIVIDYVAYSGSIEILKFLKRQEADLSHEDAISEALMYKHMKIAKILIFNGSVNISKYERSYNIRFSRR